VNEPITLPFWVFGLLLAGTAITLCWFGLRPLWYSGWAWWSHRIVKVVNPHLQLKLSPFTLTDRRQLADRLASDPKILEAINEEALVSGRSVADVQKNVRRIAYSMVPAFSPVFYFRVGYVMARSALRALYRVRIGFTDENALRQIDEDSCVVFFMNHRTNVDYVLVSYLTSPRTMLSFGVGEWSHIWPIQPLMRAAGGYFLQRDSGNPLYRKVLERYVQMATEAKVPHAMFPEGALSPDGGLQPPRLGLLSYMTRNFDPAEFRGKGRAFVYRSGAKIGTRVFWQMLRRKRNFGFACANFGTPVSFKRWLLNHWVDWSKLDRAERFEWLSKLGGELMEDIAALIPVPPVALVCRVLIKEDGALVSMGALKTRYAQEADRAKANGANLFLPDGDGSLGIPEALTLLRGRGMIVQTGSDEISVPQSQRRLVEYYANSIRQFFDDAEG